MENALFLPQPGYRFYFAEHPDYIFEIASIALNTIRYAATIGGKICTLDLNEFESRYKSGEIICSFAPEKLVLNPQCSQDIHRKERYVLTALQQLEYPTSLDQLSPLIQEIATSLDDKSPPSPRTVARWIFKYKSYSHNKLFLKNEHKGNHSLRFSPEVYQILNQTIDEVYLKPEFRTSKDVRACMLGKFVEQGIALNHLPSLRCIQRHIKKIDPYLILKAKKGSRIAKKSFQASGRSIISPFALYMVEIDTHYLDVIVIDPKTNVALGRPFLACAIDVHTRAIVGTYISMYPPSATTTLAVIKDMVTRPNQDLPGGIPSIIIPDNGVEFKNNSLARVCDQLKITLTPSQIGTPNNKPHIERFFSTLTHGIIQKLPGTTFSNPSERGSYNSTKNVQFTIEQLKKYIDMWINEIYHCSIHSMTGNAPSVMWQSAITDIKPSHITEVDAKILCRRPIERTIHHGQVQVDGLSYFSHALTTLQAKGVKKVTVMIDDLDLNEVYIVDPNDMNVVIQADSTNQDYTSGLSRIIHIEVQKRKKQLSKLDQQKLGKFSDLFGLYKLLHEIQTDIIKKKPKLKPIKLELPLILQNIEKNLSPIVDIQEEPNIEVLSENKKNTLSFGSLEVVKNGKI
ncbi:Mu transposase C-terminal domain-containing protein [Acinetobacter wuhouensis]|uniref:Transposase n=1 Tax=Acinetobacter wuhouensis TaxID=1879050 RepID=A0A4V2DMM3_9GAMM|nr:Mu transposase C-terminal domain-containing protein [Acinetobacter wuhouensis]RZG43275.1 transposase [Acinetobacter wuhouensis]